MLGEFRAAKGLKARLNVAHEILKSLSDLDDKNAVAKEVIAALNAEIGTHQRTQPAVALGGDFCPRRIAPGRRRASDRGRIGRANTIWQQETTKIGAVLELMPAAKHRRALQSFKEASPDHWSDSLLGPLNGVSCQTGRRNGPRA